MAVWQENLKRLLSQKEVLIIHGNVRDTAYIRNDGRIIRGLNEVIKIIGKELEYKELRFWGVFYHEKNISESQMWAIERVVPLDSSGGQRIERIGAQNPENVLLSRWLQNEIRRTDSRIIFIINYIDKLTPYSPRGIYPKDKEVLITLVQKIIENIPANNRLIMVALQDTMIPLDYYTNSPKVAVTEIPMPDKEERKRYFSTSLRNFPTDHRDFLANITDGLYIRDLDNILGDVCRAQNEGVELSHSYLRKLVNRYRIGTEEDPWAQLAISGPPKGLIDCAVNWFKGRVIGQDYAVEEVVKAIKKARAGVVGLASGQASKPRAVFFFAGPTGTGKTFLAKKLAEYLFDSEDAFIRFDMSEFKEEHTVSKLIGSPPGYVGYEEGGQLTKAVKNRPFSVILFDEIDKAHPKIMDIFLQILDDGRLTDSRGQIVFFTESVIIFTSNIGTRTHDNRGSPINERADLERIINDSTTSEEKKQCLVREHFVKSVREFFIYEISRPELLNRIGSHIISFNYIDTENAQRMIIKSKLKDISANFQDKFSHLRHTLTFSEEVVDYFLEKHRHSIERFGGRGLVNAIEDEVGHILADQLLWAEINKQAGVQFQVSITREGQLVCRRS